LEQRVGFRHRRGSVGGQNKRGESHQRSNPSARPERGGEDGGRESEVPAKKGEKGHAKGQESAIDKGGTSCIPWEQQFTRA